MLMDSIAPRRVARIVESPLHTEALWSSGTLGVIATVVTLLAAPLLLLGPLAIRRLRFRLPTSALLLPLLPVALLGVLGTRSGHRVVLDVVGNAEPYLHMPQLFQGTIQALGSALLVLVLAAFGFSLAGWGTALAAALHPGAPAQRDTRSLLVGLGGAASGAALAALGTGATAWTQGGVFEYALISVSVLLALALCATGAPLIASLRVAPSDTEMASRSAATRLMAGVSVALGVGLLGEASRVWQCISALEGVAQASPDLKSHFLANGILVADYTSTVGWLVALIPLGAGLASSLRSVRQAKPSAALGFVLATSQALLVVGLARYAVHLAQQTLLLTY